MATVISNSEIVCTIIYVMLQNVFNVIAADHTVYGLLLHSLSLILSQAASSNPVCLAVLQDKQQFSSITGSITTTAKTITGEVDYHKEPVIVITDDEDEGENETQLFKSLSGQEQKMDTSHSDVSSVEIGSQVAFLKMSDSSASVPSALVDGSSGSTAQFTLGMLSSALQNVNQSLGIVPSNKQEEEETGVVNLESNTGNCTEVPEEKRPRLDTHEVITLQQDTLPQDIHDKLHSNIR